MKGLLILGIILIPYGALSFFGAIFKVQKLWEMAKIKAFRESFLGEVGTRIFLIIWGGGAIAGGIVLIIYNMPK